MYDAPTTQIPQPVKREITGPIDEEDDEDQSSSSEDLDEKESK